MLGNPTPFHRKKSSEKILINDKYSQNQLKKGF